MSNPLIAAVGGLVPQVDPTAFVAVNATVVGAVTLAAGSNVWYGAVLRGDAESIAVGPETNIQDNCTVHSDPDFPTVIGARVSVGHNAVLHGCTIEDDVLIGMNSTVLNGAHIGAGALIAAGAVVPQGMRVPPGVLVAGVPGRIRRELTEEERAGIKANGAGYLFLARAHGEIAPL
ncbi:gamma carbonic anhydrase family protein [Embleya hyalina]|uniref:Gamma carbonic anhydrase family protein n=1 Tax=Embleya hyalina TaxID=516124 RepID=A0A401Z100_9ACTN|nr:gamma carbonic anhydrase family protein [Embleya hyalina]GCE00534.1 gamma carbonic anhydrase family protein [Embleya hyalina]